MRAPVHGERFAWLCGPCQHKGRSPPAFLTACTDVGEKAKWWDLKAVSGQTSKIESDFLITKKNLFQRED